VGNRFLPMSACMQGLVRISWVGTGSNGVLQSSCGPFWHLVSQHAHVLGTEGGGSQAVHSVLWKEHLEDVKKNITQEARPVGKAAVCLEHLSYRENAGMRVCRGDHLLVTPVCMLATNVWQRLCSSFLPSPEARCSSSFWLLHLIQNASHLSCNNNIKFRPLWNNSKSHRMTEWLSWKGPQGSQISNPTTTGRATNLHI